MRFAIAVLAVFLLTRTGARNPKDPKTLAWGRLVAARGANSSLDAVFAAWEELLSGEADGVPALSAACRRH